MKQASSVRLFPFNPIRALFLFLLLFVSTPSTHIVQAGPAAQEGTGPSGKLTYGGLELEWQISGVDVGDHFQTGGTWSAKGTVSSTTVRFSGMLRHAISKNSATNSRMGANINLAGGKDGKNVHWEGVLDNQSGLSHELPFDFTLQVPAGTPVEMGASVSQCNDVGVCDSVTVSFPFDPMLKPAGTCLATLTPNGDITPGRELYFDARVVDEQNNPVTPRDGTWLYNGVGNNNGNMQWDGKAATVEYQYTCPLDGKTLSASYTIPAQSAGPGWVVVVGMGGLGLVGMAAGAALVAGSKKKVNRADQPQAPRYILQLSSVELKVKPGEQVPLTIQAWRISPNGSPVAAPEAAIHVLIPPSPAGLVISANQGRGSLNCTFSVPNPTICADLMVIVRCSAAVGTVQAQVRVSIVPVYELKLEWNGLPAGPLQPGGKEVFACASVSARPQPDAQSTPDVLAGKISLAVRGPNSERVKLQCAPPVQQGPYAQNGFLWIPITIAPPDQGASLQPGNPSLVASFMAGGQLMNQSLVLELNAAGVFDAWARGKKQADVIFNEASDHPAWDFGELRVYFHDPQDENKVVPPPGNLGRVVLQSDPADILELRNYGEAPESPGVFAGEIFLKEGAALETYFGSDLTDKNGQISLVVTASGDNGQLYRSQPIQYQLCPTAELVALQCEKGLMQEVKSHTYTNLNLGSLEFLTDGSDELILAIFYRRTDQPIDLSRPVPFGRPIKADVQGQDSIQYLIGSKDTIFEAEDGLPGLYYIRVKSASRMLATQPRIAGEVALYVEARLVDKPSFYRIKTNDLNINSRNDSLKQRIQPVFPSIHLWVIPSYTSGYSIAGATVGIVRPNQPVEPWTESPALLLTTVCHNFKLEVEEQLSEGYFLTKGGKRADSGWLRAWKLKYSELNWKTVFGAWGRVYCAFDLSGGSEYGEAAVFELTLKENLDRMMAAFMADKDSLDLTNQEFTETYSGLELLSMIRAEARGPWYNLRNMAVKVFTLGLYPMGPDHPWEKYTCSSYSLRLLRYFLARRHGAKDPETAQFMNGIEFCGYGMYLRWIAGLHSWMGFFLSGTKYDEEPIFMDPWWRQNWDDLASTDDYGYKKQNAKAVLVAAYVVAEIILIARLLWPFVRKAAQQVGQKYPKFADFLQWLKDVLYKERKMPVNIPGWGKSLLFGGAGGSAWLMTPIEPNTELGGLFRDINTYEAYHEIDVFEKYKAKLVTSSTPSLPAKVDQWPGVK